MMQLLRTRYTFGYTPDDVTPDGKFREIKLTVSEPVKKERGELKIFSHQQLVSEGLVEHDWIFIKTLSTSKPPTR
jgi:hypothetical protein